MNVYSPTTIKDTNKYKYKNKENCAYCIFTKSCQTEKFIA